MRREALVRLLLSGLCFALAAVARLSPDVCAWYADRVFPAVRQAFCALNEAFPTIITAATTSLASAIMTESSLSFLGVGVQQPMSSWGSLLQAAQGYMQNNIYMAFIPGLLIVIVIFAFNKLGNVLRVFADPQVMSGERG